MNLYAVVIENVGKFSSSKSGRNNTPSVYEDFSSAQREATRKNNFSKSNKYIVVELSVTYVYRRTEK